MELLMSSKENVFKTQCQFFCFVGLLFANTFKLRINKELVGGPYKF